MTNYRYFILDNNNIFLIYRIKGKTVKGIEADVINIVYTDKNYVEFEMFYDETIISDEELKRLKEITIPLYIELFEYMFNIKNKLDYVKRIIDNRHAE